MTGAPPPEGFEEEGNNSFLLKLAGDHSPFMAHLTYEMTRARGQAGVPSREAFLESLGDFNYLDGFFLSYLMLLSHLRQADRALTVAEHSMANLTHLLTGEPQVDSLLFALMANTNEDMSDDELAAVTEAIEKLSRQEVTAHGGFAHLLLATIILKLARSLADATHQQVDEILRKLALGVQLGNWQWRY